MPFPPILSAIAGFAVLSFATIAPAKAQSDKPADTASAVGKIAPALKALIAPKAGSEICFARTYDAAHLKRHPKQKVRHMSLRISVEHLEMPNLYRYNFWMRAHRGHAAGTADPLLRGMRQRRRDDRAGGDRQSAGASRPCRRRGETGRRGRPHKTFTLTKAPVKVCWGRGR